MNKPRSFSRRRFLAWTASAAAGISVPAAGRHAAPGRGLSDTLGVGVIGVGARGTVLLTDLLNCRDVRVLAVSDVYTARRLRAQATTKAQGCVNWEDMLARTDIDAVVIATPNHWHAPMTLAAVRAGKHVYCETPMAHDIREAMAVRDAARASGLCVQIGVQETSSPAWRLARDMVRRGELGEVVWSQANGGRTDRSDSRMDDTVAPSDVDWKRWLGSTPVRPFDPVRYQHWRKFWDYSGGIATDAFYPQLAALLLTIGPAFPERVSAAGGVYVRDGRETPDSFVMTAEYSGGHSIVLTSSPAHGQETHAVIRGREASLFFDQTGLSVLSETAGGKASRVESRGHAPDDEGLNHLGDWLRAIRSGTACACPPELGYRTMAAISLAVDAYRSRTTLAWDPAKEQAVTGRPRVLLA